jgi:hypothetical protein
MRFFLMSLVLCLFSQGALAREAHCPFSLKAQVICTNTGFIQMALLCADRSGKPYLAISTENSLSEFPFLAKQEETVDGVEYTINDSTEKKLKLFGIPGRVVTGRVVITTPGSSETHAEFMNCNDHRQSN